MRTFAAALMNDRDAVAELGRYLDKVAIDLHISAVLDEDLRSPEPVVLEPSVRGHDIVANDGVIGYLVLDAFLPVQEKLVTFV